MTKNLSVFLILVGLAIAGALLYAVVAEDGDELPVGLFVVRVFGTEPASRPSRRLKWAQVQRLPISIL
ncbi:hypothetical protein [Ruegeria atlantica]|uniref:Uncharacterized protein n=1 Tax=Ruegeria atlantica TaxID=81569 RepID=A0A0P1E7Z3_9RHOB|nr:hypothetical protein [Ruegeria atlantica]CUH45135.1 hypothetical protein RUM4293_04045 [Ruegeria atlantica]